MCYINVNEVTIGDDLPYHIFLNLQWKQCWVIPYTSIWINIDDSGEENFGNKERVGMHQVFKVIFAKLVTYTIILISTLVFFYKHYYSEPLPLPVQVITSFNAIINYAHKRSSFKPSSKLLIGSKLFTNCIIEQWISLPPSVINAHITHCFKKRLDLLWTELR